MSINEVPQGINVVIETDQLVYIGRFRHAGPGLVRLQDCAVHENLPGGKSEPYVRKTAKYGVEVSENEIQIQAGSVRRVRALKDVPKE